MKNMIYVSFSYIAPVKITFDTLFNYTSCLVKD